MRKILALSAILLCLPATAQEAEPPLPRERPEAVTADAPAALRPAWTIVEAPVVPLPRQRTDEPDEAAAPETPPAVPETPVAPRLYQVACPAVLKGRVEARALPPIADEAGGGRQCGAQSPLELTGVFANGRMVPLSGPVTTDCGMASAMPDWIEAVDSYLMARQNTQVAEVLVGTSYMCRNVNNGSGGNLSFHAFADAIDVTGFRLEDGRAVTVAGDWADGLSAEGRLLRYAHDAACSQFTTVLGPEANAEHHDHFHVDLGCHGKTCTARLCE